MLEKIKADIEAAVPGCLVEIIPNGSPSDQHSLLIDPAHAQARRQRFCEITRTFVWTTAPMSVAWIGWIQRSLKRSRSKRL